MAVERSWFLVHDGGVVVRREGDGWVLPGDEDAARVGVSAEQAHPLGHLAGVPAFAAAVGSDAVVEAPLEFRALRDLYLSTGEAMAAMAGRAVQIVQWEATHRFCGRCATPNERVPGEWCMRCPSCRLDAYPRIAPAIIVLVRRGNEALLARGSRFPLPFYSTLAGFAEPGESLEEALVREVREEAGIDVGGIRYFGSQPWPFPHSLMVGFFADWHRGELCPDGTEILDAQWFRADALPTIPPRISIARRLIDAWIEEVGGR
ncbi:MAG TPA: NAD(+) diphosphatase [Polyangiaceae bacterium]|nr:NAD(+) diphosphatase [Polyangiaceae bacterium]